MFILISNEMYVSIFPYANFINKLQAGSTNRMIKSYIPLYTILLLKS